MWFPIVTSIAVPALINKLFSFHSIHRHLWRCKHRTDTRKQTRFVNLTRYWVYNPRATHPIGPQDPVTLDFTRAATDPELTMTVEIPPGSRWGSLFHWHETDAMCIKLFTILSGAWIVFHAYWGVQTRPVPAGREVTRSLGHYGKYFPGFHLDAVAKVTFFWDGAFQLQHQLCSAVQDAEIYADLCSTPPWIRLGLVALRRWTSQSMYYEVTQRLLMVQIRAMLSGRDYFEPHGTFKGLRWFIYPPPPWMQMFEEWTTLVISKTVLGANLWLGVLVLGMKGWYPEYELVDQKES